MKPSYENFLKSPSGKYWEKIGLRRRAGAAVPLFSIYSRQSAGIGELPDLKLLIDWCEAAGLTILQLLPMNDTGFDFRPYDAQSSFALEPVYLSLENLAGVDPGPYRKELDEIQKKFPAGGSRVDYGIKQVKLELLGKIFQGVRKTGTLFDAFVRANAYWLEDYALFRVLKEEHQERGWFDWPAEFKGRRREALEPVKERNSQKILFYTWLQYQLFSQFEDVKKYAARKGVLLMGDLPFLVSRDSADVWAHPELFKLDGASGAPPDPYFSKGQRWGMPPYEWSQIQASDYVYWRERLKTAENFYDLFRMDHFVGMFRIWTVPLSEPLENFGLHGAFDPPDEAVWERQGRERVLRILESTGMLPCAEDLGIVPDCSYRLLRDWALPGMEVQRWIRDWGRSYDFRPPSDYRPNSIATLSTHDMSNLRGWWEYEMGTIDEGLFQREVERRGVSFEKVRDRLFDSKNSHYGRLRWKKEIDSVQAFLRVLEVSSGEAGLLTAAYQSSYGETEKFLKFLQVDSKERDFYRIAKRALERISETASIFSIQLLQDWLWLEESIGADPWNFRINFPGVDNDKNWRLVLPLSLEALQRWPFTESVKRMNEQAGRLSAS
ncbi:MAG: 4-alpha-glucanotransferase [Candidatus Omnitrophica bacterium]|nr:4-alpha-glucanotransferase [Candidatus Omnitrophota bacterium]